MTGNRTTELRKLLTERGIEYETNDHMGVCETSWNGFTAMQLTPSAKLIMTVTPEQAIAVTLGSGTLTAEQVMAIAGKHQPDYCSDTHVCFDWQAIADELNAELGSGTCEMYRDEYGTWHCKSCESGADTDTGSDGTLDTWCDAWPPNYCPNCGRKVVS